MALAIAAIPSALRPAGAAGEPAAACDRETFGTGTVRSIRDGRTLTLADGREVRLAGLESPPGPAPNAQAREALDALARGREVILKKSGGTADRYGRTVAYLVVKTPDGERAAQDSLLSAGHAMLGSRTGSPGCASGLRAVERAARQAARGVWSDPNFAVLAAGNPDVISTRAGQFRLIQGKILSVRDSGSTIYMNFGRRWSRDFSVTMLKRNRRLFAAAGVDPKQLEGREVLVRGIIERRSGPTIEAAWPEQIEILK